MRLSCLFLVVLMLGATAAGAESWTLPPAGYAYAPIARCAEPAAAELRPNEARYEICRDQMALFKAAVAQAQADGKLLIVDFGATWCPWCRSLQAQWQSAALLGSKAGNVDLAATFALVEIGISTIHAGRRVDVASGQAVLAEVLAATSGVKLRSVPFIAVVDPGDRARTIARNLDDFEQASTGRHDATAVRDFLVGAHHHLRKGAAAPSEPGWLAKKLNRAWARLFGT